MWGLWCMVVMPMWVERVHSSTVGGGECGGTKCVFRVCVPVRYDALDTCMSFEPKGYSACGGSSDWWILYVHWNVHSIGKNWGGLEYISPHGGLFYQTGMYVFVVPRQRCVTPPCSSRWTSKTSALGCKTLRVRLLPELSVCVCCFVVELCCMLNTFFPLLHWC